MICDVCKVRTATELHHLLSKSKWAKKLYGELIHHESNLINICSICHHSKPIPKQTEKEFCDKLGIEVRSKTGFRG